MKAGEFEPWQCVGLCSSDLKPDQVRTRRGHTEGQYDWGALSTRTLMTLLRDRSEYFTAHTQRFYKTYWNLANFCLYDCLSIHIHQIMQLAILLSQPLRLLHLLLSNQVFIVFSEGLHQLQDSHHVQAVVFELEKTGKTGKTGRERQVEHVFRFFNMVQHTHRPNTILAAVLLCRHWLLHGISSENLRGHWSAYTLRVDAWMILQACKTSISYIDVVRASSKLSQFVYLFYVYLCLCNVL